ncbi:RraA family protein [Nonomuraea sp. H19]|uniref:RraA family protein n=1 Tax=Nonomuraea sp. H19 TaxID=3452206 RepID=UPI003F89C9DA
MTAPEQHREVALTLPSDDPSRFALVRRYLYTPVVGDILDQVGRYRQFLPPQIHPLEPSMIVVGRAMPVAIGDVHGVQRKPFGRLTEALDQLQPQEVFLVATGQAQCAAWGEILTTTARTRGAAGAVVDAYHRDTSKVLAQEWPVFSRGAYAQDAGVRAAVIDYRVPIQVGQVFVTPGDLIIGDRDGVVVVPHEIEGEVLERALQKAMTESVVRKAIEDGMTSTDAFATYGVL